MDGVGKWKGNKGKWKMRILKLEVGEPQRRERKRKGDSLSHSGSEHEKETYMVGMKFQELIEGAGLSEKHTVARWNKNEMGEVIEKDGMDGKSLENLGVGF